MRNTSDMTTHELVSTAVQAAEGTNLLLFQDCLSGLQRKPQEDLLQGISSIMILLGLKGINGSFKGGAEQIFNTLQ